MSSAPRIWFVEVIPTCHLVVDRRTVFDVDGRKNEYLPILAFQMGPKQFQRAYIHWQRNANARDKNDGYYFVLVPSKCQPTEKDQKRNRIGMIEVMKAIHTHPDLHTCLQVPVEMDIGKDPLCNVDHPIRVEKSEDTKNPGPSAGSGAAPPVVTPGCSVEDSEEEEEEDEKEPTEKELGTKRLHMLEEIAQHLYKITDLMPELIQTMAKYHPIE
jgi:hypothetical protein